MTIDTGSFPYEEEPVFFPAASASLFGMLTRPTGPANGIAVTLCAGGAHLMLMQRNRVFVRLAREMAGLGYHVLRFDWRGTGESSGLVDRFSLHDLFETDVEAALRFLGQRGLDRHMLLGSSFGARTALVTAAGAAGIEGLVMVAPPIWDLPWGDPVAIRRALRLPVWRSLASLGPVRSLVQSGSARAAKKRIVVVARRMRQRRGERARERSGDGWVSPRFVEPLARVIQRGMPVLVLFGQEDEMYADFLKACEGRVGRIVEAAESQLKLVAAPGRVHGFDTLQSQDVFVDVVTGWFRQFSATPASGGESGGRVAGAGSPPATASDDGDRAEEDHRGDGD